MPRVNGYEGLNTYRHLIRDIGLGLFLWISLSTGWSETLIFAPTARTDGAIDFSWFNPNNWHTNNAVGGLDQSFRIPGVNDTAEVTGLADASQGKVEIESLIVDSTAQINGGQFSVNRLYLEPASTLRNLAVYLKTQMAGRGPGVMLNSTTLTIDPAATARIEALAGLSGGLILSGGSVIRNQGKLLLENGTQIAALGGGSSNAPSGSNTDRIEVFPGAGLTANGSASLSGIAGPNPTLSLINQGMVRVEAPGALLFGQGILWGGGTNGIFQAAYRASNVFSAGLTVESNVTFTLNGLNFITGDIELDGRLNVGGSVPGNLPSALICDAGPNELTLRGTGALTVNPPGNRPNDNFPTSLHLSGAIVLAGPSVRAGGSGLRFTGNATKQIRNASVIDNFGQAWIAEGDIELGSKSAFNNFGRLSIEENTRIFGFGGALKNSGDLTIRGTNVDISVPFDNVGAVDLGPGILILGEGRSIGPFLPYRTSTSTLGGEVHFHTGRFTLDPGTTFHPSATVKVTGGTLVLNTDISVSKFALEGGGVDGPATLTIYQLLNWSEGAMTGSGLIYGPPTATATITGKGPKTLSGRRFLNGGLVRQSANLGVGERGLIINLTGAVWDVAGDFSLEGVGLGTIQNGGSFRKSAGSGSASIGIPFVNSGTLEVLAGGLFFQTNVSLGVVIPPRLDALSRSETSFTIGFTSAPGVSYMIDYADRIDPAKWQPLASVAGTGSSIQVIDPTPAAAARFYRIRVQ